MLTRRLTPFAGRRAPMVPFANLRDEMDRFFTDWMTGMEEPTLALTEKDFFVPQMNVVENEKELKATVELPGLELKDVEVELMKDRLTLHGKKEEIKEEKGETFYRHERRFGSFFREIPLPWEVDADKIKVNATFKNGVLTVKVPRPKEIPAGKKRIEIHAD